MLSRASSRLGAPVALATRSLGPSRSLATSAKSAEGKSFMARHGTKLKVAAALTAGYMIGQEESALRKLALPNPNRACCDAPALTAAQAALPAKLQALVGKDHVIDGNSNSATQYTVGSRIGKGKALAVVRPGTLKEAKACLEACVAAGVAVAPQGANTGLTGGSVPRDTLTDRPWVVINMRRLDKIVPVGREGKQVLCFAGAGIYTLAKRLGRCGRDSHSSLGSIFLDPSVAAGVAFGSGGTQTRKGPVYTERALYCRVTAEGGVELVNELGLLVQGGEEELFDKLELGELGEEDLDPACRAQASDRRYAAGVCDLNGDVSRYNADVTGPDPNRSEGKVFLLATVHDTFPLPEKTELVWVGCRDFATAQDLKARVALAAPADLPQSCEYMNRDTFDCVDGAGRILIKMIEIIGMENLKHAWNLKITFNSLPLPFADVLPDLFLYYANSLLPEPLSKELMSLGKEYDHHVLLELAEFGGGELGRLRERLDAYAAARPAGAVKYHVCRPKEVPEAKYFRFVVAPAFNTMVIGQGNQGLNLDYSLPKNERSVPELPAEVAAPLARLRYSHFGCNVVHEDLTFRPGVDVHAEKMKIKKVVEGLKGKLPAEHGHGTEYKAPADTQARWRRMDPTNTLNPGVGGLPYGRNYEG